MSATAIPVDVTLSPAEASALLDIPEKRVRKEIEHGLFGTKLSFAVAVYLRALTGLDMDPPVVGRRRLLERLGEALDRGRSVPDEIEIGGFFSLHVRSLVDDVAKRLQDFHAWCDARVVEDPNVLGGEPVFSGSRLAVRGIGSRLDRGEKIGLLREDYPYLTPTDLEFARLYARAYPRVGRPRESASSPSR